LLFITTLTSLPTLPKLFLFDYFYYFSHTINMVFLLASLLSLAIFTFLFLLLLNYAFYVWENRRISELAQKARQQNQDESILNKNQANHSFTTKDWGHELSRRTSNFFGERSLTPISSENSSSWWHSVTNFLRSLQHNFWPHIQKTWRQLLHLTQTSSSSQTHASSHSHNPKQQEDLDHLVNKIGEYNQQSTTSSNSTPTYPEDTDKLTSNNSELGKLPHKIQNAWKQSSPTSTSSSQDSDTKPQAKEPDRPSPTQTTSSPSDTSSDEATINLASKTDNPDNQTSQSESKTDAVFEKLENRILEKLKKQGLNNYEIWLELGELYEKYNQREKALEVYALVLKHSEDDSKKIARNRLIGLS
jgi:hypothetical protein